MTTGAVIFAQNNSGVDYVKLAVFAASKIKQYLTIPVSIITDSRGWLETSTPDHPFDQIIDIEFDSVVEFKKIKQIKKFYDGSISNKNLEWKNEDRTNVYKLSPYDKTLVIDSDYILNSNILSSALESDYDFQIYRNSLDLAGWRDTAEFTRINQYSIPFYWATVFVFKKNPVTESFFNLISYIKDNWEYFKLLYSVNSQVYRNDLAFSIAIHIMNGKTEGIFAVELPGKMSYILDRDILIGTDGDKMKFLVEKEKYLGEYTLVKTTGIDVHVMNKASLSRYINGGSGV
jgi:hypothetical protein